MRIQWLTDRFMAHPGHIDMYVQYKCLGKRSSTCQADENKPRYALLQNNLSCYQLATKAQTSLLSTNQIVHPTSLARNSTALFGFPVSLPVASPLLAVPFLPIRLPYCQGYSERINAVLRIRHVN